jgi:hypothetical protein
MDLTFFGTTLDQPELSNWSATPLIFPNADIQSNFPLNR